MHRRGFIAFATALLFPPLVAGTVSQTAGQQPHAGVAQLRADLIRYARMLNTRHTLGNAWLATQQQPALKPLLDTLTAQLAADPYSSAETVDVRSLVAAQVRSDFQTGNTVRLDGWILSVTEVRLCGVACLLADHAGLS